MPTNKNTPESFASTKPARVEKSNNRARGGKHNKAQGVTATESVPAVPAFDTDAVARLAYSYWESRGRQGGSPEQDWLRAEQEYLKSRAAAATS